MTYEFRPYPMRLYKGSHSAIVQNKEEHKALGKGWSEDPSGKEGTASADPDELNIAELPAQKAIRIVKAEEDAASLAKYRGQEEGREQPRSSVIAAIGEAETALTPPEGEGGEE